MSSTNTSLRQSAGRLHGDRRVRLVGRQVDRQRRDLPGWTTADSPPWVLTTVVGSAPRSLMRSLPGLSRKVARVHRALHDAGAHVASVDQREDPRRRLADHQRQRRPASATGGRAWSRPSSASHGVAAHEPGVRHHVAAGAEDLAGLRPVELAVRRVHDRRAGSAPSSVAKARTMRLFQNSVVKYICGSSVDVTIMPTSSSVFLSMKLAGLGTPRRPAPSSAARRPRSCTCACDQPDERECDQHPVEDLARPSLWSIVEST